MDDEKDKNKSLQKLAQEAFGKAQAAKSPQERLEHLRTCKNLLVSLQQLETDQDAQKRMQETLEKVEEMVQKLQGGAPPPPPLTADSDQNAVPAAAPPPLGDDDLVFITDHIRQLPALQQTSRVLLVGPKGNELGRHARFLASREHGSGKNLVLCSDAVGLQALEPASTVGLINLDAASDADFLADVLDAAAPPVFAVSSAPWKLPPTLLGRFGTKLHVRGPSAEDKRRILRAVFKDDLSDDCIKRFEDLTCGDSGPLTGVRSPPLTLVDVKELAELTAGQIWAESSGTVISSGRGSGNSKPASKESLLLKNAQSSRSTEASLDHDLMAMFVAARCP